MTVSIKNRRVYFDYEIQEEIEAGIKLTGAEVKSIKEGKGNLTGAHVKIDPTEVWLVGFSVPRYSKSSDLESYDPSRTRKLLLHSREISSLHGKVSQQGYTLIPLKIYTKGEYIKVSIGIAKGRKKADKRQVLMERDIKRQMQREIKESIDK